MYEGYLSSSTGEYSFVMYQQSEDDVVKWAHDIIKKFRSNDGILRISLDDHEPYKELFITKPNVQLSLFD